MGHCVLCGDLAACVPLCWCGGIACIACIFLHVLAWRSAPLTHTCIRAVETESLIWLPVGHPLAGVEGALRHGGACERCSAWTRLLLVTPCIHLLCTDCAGLNRRARPPGCLPGWHSGPAADVCVGSDFESNLVQKCSPAPHGAQCRPASRHTGCRCPLAISSCLSTAVQSSVGAAGSAAHWRPAARHLRCRLWTTQSALSTTSARSGPCPRSSSSCSRPSRSALPCLHAPVARLVFHIDKTSSYRACSLKWLRRMWAEQLARTPSMPAACAWALGACGGRMERVTRHMGPRCAPR